MLLMHGLQGHWNYVCRTVLGISDLLQPLEDAICQCFISALTGRPPPSDVERALLATLVHLGGLGIVKPTITSGCSYQASRQLTIPLVEAIASQDVDSFFHPAKTVLDIHNHIHHNQDVDLLSSHELTAMCIVGQRKGFFLLAVYGPH